MQAMPDRTGSPAGEQKDYLQMLQDIVVSANEAKTVEESLEYALKRICSETGWPVGHAIFPLTGKIAEAGGLWWVADDPEYAEFRDLRESLHWVPSVGLPGRVLSSGQPAWYVEGSAEKRRHTGELSMAFAFPILSGKLVVGVLEFFSEQAEAPDRLLQDVMAHVGTLLGRVVERSHAARALQQSETRFRSMFEASALGVMLIDVDRHVLAANDAMRRMLGISPEELAGMDVSRLLRPDDLDAIVQSLTALVDGKVSRADLEARMQRIDGRVVWARAIGSMVPGGGEEEARQILLMVEDITLKRDLESELIELQQYLLNEREQERLQIARRLHEGPLQEWCAVNFELDGVADDLKDESQSYALRQLRRLVEKQIVDLRTLCNELRPPTLDPFGLEKAIHSNAIKFMNEHPDIKLILDLQPDGLALNDDQRLAMYRIYQESLKNILLHSGATEVIVRLTLSPETVTLKVQDNGRGFEVPEQWLPLARQGHLGLVGARQRAEQLGGSVQILSVTGQGTLITAVIPRGMPA